MAWRLPERRRDSRRVAVPGRIPPGFEDAAESLGMAPEALMQVLYAASGPHADLDEVAEALGVDAGRLRAVLPAPPSR